MKIEFLKVYSPNLKEQRNFYSQVLQLPVKEVSETNFSVKIGYSILEFEENPKATPYHIAFHIPPQKIKESANWLRNRVEILPDDGEEIIDFPAWKAKSAYFYDADKNIIEFISRRDLFEPSEEPFSAEQMLGIAEIGLATESVEEKFNFLNSSFGLTKFTGDYQHFCATGDDEGLFIIINRHQKDWIPTGDMAYPSEFEIRAGVKNAIFGAVFRSEKLQLL